MEQGNVGKVGPFSWEYYYFLVNKEKAPTFAGAVEIDEALITELTLRGS